MEISRELDQKSEFRMAAVTKPPYSGVLKFTPSSDPAPLLGAWKASYLPYSSNSMFVDFWQDPLGPNGLIPTDAKLHMRVRLGAPKWFPWQVVGLQLRVNPEAAWQGGAFAIDHVRQDTSWFTSVKYANPWYARLSGYCWQNGGEGALDNDPFWSGIADQYEHGVRFKIGYKIWPRQSRHFRDPEEADKVVEFAWTLDKPWSP